jgi:cobalamin transport system substrate-binding protein
VFRLTLVAVVAAAPKARFPQRIVSLSPTATESLFAIGAGPQVIAVDDQSDYPKSAPRTRLSGFTPNIEAIAAYKPDLVIAANDIKGLVAGLRKLKIPVLLQPAVATLAGTYAQIRQLGKVTGHETAASRLSKSMRAKITALVASVHKPATPLSVYHELTPDYYSATSKTFIGRVYSLFGLSNIADAADSTGSGYPKLSAEYIVAANPDVIVLADTRCCGQSAATVSARPGWNRIAAVRNGTIVRIDDSIASRWGPRVVNYVRAVASALRTISG